MIDGLDKAREILAGARSLLVLTGAGVSAESGVPTFRGADGLWNNEELMRLATPEGFARDPRRVWEWYDARRRHIAICAPNPAHHAIAAMEQRFPRFLLATQNVDGLHQIAGSRRMIELHGSLWRVHPVGTAGPGAEDRRVPIEPIPPRDEQGRLLRPGVIWFGERLPPSAMEELYEFMDLGVQALLVVGTSGAIGYIHGIVDQLAAGGTAVIEVNPEPTPLSALATVTLRGPAGEVMRELG